MKNLVLISALVAAFSLVGCGKKAADEGAKAQADQGAATAQPTAEDAKPRVATYDPNLKPTNIVWDSPEKQRAWEERQAKQRAAQAAAAKAAPAAPVKAAPAADAKAGAKP